METKGNVFSLFLKDRMIQQGITLRELSRRTGLDVGHLSKVQRGLAYPPRKEDTLESIAAALQLQDSEKQDLFDKAMMVNGRLPNDLIELRENRAIPLLLRSIENNKLSEDQVEALIERIESEFEFEEGD